MAGTRKRPGDPDLSSSSRLRQRRTRSDQRVRPNMTMVVRAAAAVVLAVSVVASGVAHAHTPEVRAPMYEARRLSWEEHEADLEERKCFRRYYRMDKETFHKLAELLRPFLEVNAHFAFLRCRDGAIPVHIRLAVALRILAGASYLDVAVLFGLGTPTVYGILWDVIDAINDTPAVGAFYFPQDEAACLAHAERFKERSTDGIFQGVVAAVDGLFVKTTAPTVKDTPNVVSYFSGSKKGYGLNVQAMCTADCRFCAVSAIAPGSTNDWVAWNRSSLAEAVGRLPPGFHIIGDAAYPISEQLLTPYPGTRLSLAEDSFNFHLSQLRVKIEQAFGILVSTWGILWRPLRVQYRGRGDLITALFHLHNFLRDEKVDPVRVSEEDEETRCCRPLLCPKTATLPGTWPISGATTEPVPSRSGDTPTRAAITHALKRKKQWRPDWNIIQNSLR